MPNLTQILQSRLEGINSSSFSRAYSRNPSEVLFEFREKVFRPDFSTIDNRKERKVCFSNLRSQFDGIMIIPYEENPSLSLVTYLDPNHMMKKLLLLPLFRDKSKDDAKKFKSTPKKKFFTALRMARLEDHFLGYDFCEINGSQVKTVSFVDAVEGKRMASSYQVKFDRNDYNSQEYALTNGGEVTVRVVSQSGDEDYFFKITSLPISRYGKSTLDNHWIWQSLSTTHNCPKSVYGTTSFYRPVRNLKSNSLSRRHLKNEVMLDQHVISALKAHNNVRSHTQVVFDPVVEFNDHGENYYDNLKHQTLAEVLVDDKIRLVPLNQVNKNLLMFDYTKLNPRSAHFRR